MTTLQWAFVIGAGIAGYFGVSWLIDRGRASKEAPPEAPTPPPPPEPPAKRSAWDEFNR